MLLNKKSLILVIVLLLMISLTTMTFGAKQTDIKVGTMFAVPYPETAGGWDRVQYKGLQVLKNEFGWEISIAENVPYPKSSEIAMGYLDKGYDIIIYPDNGQIESWKELSPQYPDKWIIMMSLVDELPDSPKSAAYCVDFYIYGNLLGITMAKTSKTGVIGVTGGVPIPVLKVMFSGIIEGAKAVNPDVKTFVYYAGDWSDVAKNRETAALLTQKGADVIFTVTGPGTKGVYELAETKGAKVIGYAYDAYEDSPNSIMTSLMIDLESVYREMANDYLNGTLEHKIYSLGSKFFKLADFRGSISPEVEQDVHDTIEEFKNGKLKVPYKIHD